MKRVLIDFDFDAYSSSIVSGNLTAPAVANPSYTGNCDYLNSAVIMNLPDGTAMQSPATVAQHNVGISGCVSLAPSGSVTSHNTIVAQSSATVPLAISGFWGGHEVNLQTWSHGANQAKITDGCKLSAYGLDAQNQQVNNLNLTPAASGDATSLNYVTVAIRNHQHPIWFDDFNRYRTSSSEWQEGSNGTGSAYFQSNPGSNATLLGDSGDGYARLTCGSNSASTDNVYWRPQNELQFNDSFNGTGKRHVWRAKPTNDTDIKGSFGVMGDSAAPSGVTPAASFAFVFDSANTNVRFQHDDNQGNTTDADTGVALSAADDEFKWYEISLISGNVTAYIDGSEVASVTSNHPEGTDRQMYPFMWIEGNGSAWRSIYFDIYGFWGDEQRIDDGIYT